MIEPIDLIPPEERDKSKYGKTAQERVLNIIRDKKCTWPGEIKEITEMKGGYVYDILNILRNKGYIEKIDMGRTDDLPRVFKDRLQELWDRGFKGKKLLKQMSFYKLLNDPNKKDTKEEADIL